MERRPSLPARTAKATWAPGFLLRRSFSPGVPQESLGMTAPGHVTGRARAGRRSRARAGREGGARGPRSPESEEWDQDRT